MENNRKTFVLYKKVDGNLQYVAQAKRLIDLEEEKKKVVTQGYDYKIV